MLAALARGRPRDVVLSANWSVLEQLNHIFGIHPKVRDVCNGSYRRKQPPDIRGSGYVVESLEAALWAFHNAQTFEDAVLRAVNLGDDADTTGAVCGQLAGAYWGECAIPIMWRICLAQQDLIEGALRKLVSE
jgi:ADP-ribosyl-[dinitrogen reductase] hydrolase